MTDVGDPVPSPQALAAAEKFADQFVNWGFDRPALVPCDNGSVQVEWHRAGIDLEVYVEATGDIMSFWYAGPRLADMARNALDQRFR